MFLTYLRYSTSRRYIKLIYYFDLFGAFYYIVTNIDRLDYKRDISTISFTVTIAKFKSLVFCTYSMRTEFRIRIRVFCFDPDTHSVMKNLTSDFWKVRIRFRLQIQIRILFFLEVRIWIKIFYRWSDPVKSPPGWLSLIVLFLIEHRELI